VIQNNRDNTVDRKHFLAYTQMQGMIVVTDVIDSDNQNRTVTDRADSPVLVVLA